jgi:hypothetical protein
MDSSPIGDTYAATIGIENSDGTDGLEIYYMAPYTIDNYSILITTDWLAISPSSSYIAPSENEIATITLSAKHLALGTYTGNIYLDSNDPVDSLIIIPVSLTVTGGCDYAVGDVNGSDSYNGLDITYGVNFFKYGTPEPYCTLGSCPISPCYAFFYCGDVNASCNYNGLDITYGVNYFKFGSPGPAPCADCPPVGGITASGIKNEVSAGSILKQDKEKKDVNSEDKRLNNEAERDQKPKVHKSNIDQLN